jgi:hypothetical protein
LLVCRLKTAVDMQVLSFIVSFRVTKHAVQTAALRKHKSRVKIYRSKEENYQTTEVIRHTHALNFACKLVCESDRCETCSEFQERPYLVVHRCTGGPNIMRRKVWSDRTCIMWRISWRIVLFMETYWNGIITHWFGNWPFRQLIIYARVVKTKYVSRSWLISSLSETW